MPSLQYSLEVLDHGDHMHISHQGRVSAKGNYFERINV
jgi:hypothetical protein